MTGFLGRQIGNYHLIRLLGQGGFADIYLGEQLHLRTLAAIKILHTQLSIDNINNFRAEAKTIANLKHPNIVRVLDFGVEGMLPFLVMDYAAGGNMRQRHPKGTVVAQREAVSYIKQIASALQYAHNQGIVHRDIKPENILLGPSNEVLLSDFGIALVTQNILEESRRQGAAEAAGTIIYMAPEQYQGNAGPASDQYALAVMAYEWLCGERPFNGTYMEIAMMHLSMPPPSLSAKNPSILPDVETVLLTALAKDPQQRFKSVQAFATAFEQAFQKDEPPVIPPISQLQPSEGTTEKAKEYMEMSLHGPMGRLVLGQAPVVIGRAPDSQIPLNDSQVSLHHARIDPAGQGYSITDLGSTNGIWVSGQRLVSNVPRLLQQSDTIQIGNTRLTYIISVADPISRPDSGSPLAHDGLTTSSSQALTELSDPARYTPSRPPYTGYGQPGQPPSPAQPIGPAGMQQPSWPGISGQPPQYPQDFSGVSGIYPPNFSGAGMYTPPVQALPNAGGMPVLPSQYPPGPGTGGMPVLPPQYPPGPGTGGMPVLPPQYPPGSGVGTQSPQKGRSSSRTLTLIVLALVLIIGGSVGGLLTVKHNQDTASATSTANAVARVTAISQRNGTATAAVQATDTAIPIATATAIATSPYPSYQTSALTDPLTSRSSGQWDQNAECSFTGGSYQVSLAQQNYLFACVDENEIFSDFAYQVNMTIVRGDCGGLIFRIALNGSNLAGLYVFEVCQTGVYDLQLFSPNAQGTLQSTVLVSPTSSANIHSGLNQPNLIAVVVEGSSISMYVNDRNTPVMTKTDNKNTFSKGGIGVEANAANNPTTVAFNNAFVWMH